MLKKIVLLAAMALSLASAIGFTAPDLPVPECFPCNKKA